jgi:tRNA (adenine22-N1)-methyltransferase
MTVPTEARAAAAPPLATWRGAPRLSARLRAVLDLIPARGSVADVGSGHGRLAAALAWTGRRVIATERTPSTVGGLRRDLSRLGTVLPVRMGEGLQAMQPGEVDTVVIAGLGGRSVLRILEQGEWLPRRLVLQPMQDQEMVAEWIAARGYPATEVEVEERGRTYRAWRVDVPLRARRRTAA